MSGPRIHFIYQSKREVRVIWTLKGSVVTALCRTYVTVRYAITKLSFLVTMGLMNLEKNRPSGGALPMEMKCWQDYWNAEGVLEFQTTPLSIESKLCVCCHFSPFRSSVTPWTIAHPAPLSMGFSRQESWSGLPFPNPGIKLASLTSPALAGRFFITAVLGKPL